MPKRKKARRATSAGDACCPWCVAGDAVQIYLAPLAVRNARETCAVALDRFLAGFELVQPVRAVAETSSAVLEQLPRATTAFPAHPSRGGRRVNWGAEETVGSFISAEPG